jgi:hypothetical protein
MRTKRTTKPVRTLEECFANCCEEFRTRIADLATQHGRTWQEVYGWWREYAASNWDQSALLSEFEPTIPARIALAGA